MKVQVERSRRMRTLTPETSGNTGKIKPTDFKINQTDITKESKLMRFLGQFFYQSTSTTLISVMPHRTARAPHVRLCGPVIARPHVR